VSRLLVDENLPPSLAAVLRQAGHDAVHVNQVGLARTPDETIMTRAEQEGWTVVTLDRDYPHLLRDGAEGPSVIRISQRGGRAITGATRQAEALQAALPKLEAYLLGGASVTLDARGVRVDPLPLGRDHGLDAGGADRVPRAARRATTEGLDPARANRADRADRAGRNGSTATRDGAPATRNGAVAPRDSAVATRDGAVAARPTRQPTDGIERGRRAHPSSPELGR